MHPGQKGAMLVCHLWEGRRKNPAQALLCLTLKSKELWRQQSISAGMIYQDKSSWRELFRLYCENSADSGQALDLVCCNRSLRRGWAPDTDDCLICPGFHPHDDLGGSVGSSLEQKSEG
jgi:hypothetical protein